MRFLASLLFAVSMLFTGIVHADGFVGQKFVKTIYVKFGGSSVNGGGSYNAAKSCAADGNLWAIPANVLIEKVYMVIDTSITGSTGMDVGDDDDPNGFIDASLSVTLGTPGLYGYDAKNAGAYLRIQTAGGTDALDIFVVPNAKYYSAAGKTLKLDVTTACTAGKFRVVVEGIYLGAKS